MLAYSIYSVIGVGVFQVSQYCLGQTASVFLNRERGSNGAAADAADTTMDSTTGQSFLVMLGIMDCLLNRTQPTPLRVLSPCAASSSGASLANVTSFSLDPHLGLCVPLLRHYHRLCSISNLLLDTSDSSTISSLYDQLVTIHNDADSWRPPALHDLINNRRQTSQPEPDTAQVIHLRAQAKLYRLGILLMAHRLRHPCGDKHHDRLAAAWSSEILSELDTANTVTDGQRVRFVTMPFIIAAVEITENHHSGLTPSGFQIPRERALHILDEQCYSQQRLGRQVSDLMLTTHVTYLVAAKCLLHGSILCH